MINYRYSVNIEFTLDRLQGPMFERAAGGGEIVVGAYTTHWYKDSYGSIVGNGLSLGVGASAIPADVSMGLIASNAMRVPVYSIGPTTVSVILYYNPKHTTEDAFDALASGRYENSSDPQSRLSINPFYFADTNLWLAVPYFHTFIYE